jgi:hypothetical protein
MNLLSQETAARIWECYSEINRAEKLLEEMAKLEEQFRFEPEQQKLKDAFGRRRDLQLGIPSGENSHRLFNVAPKLAKSVIHAHIATKKAELIEANEQAKIELNC